MARGSAGAEVLLGRLKPLSLILPERENELELGT